MSRKHREEVENILEQRISDYLGMRKPFADSNIDAVPGSVRHEVLRRSGNRCEACDVSSQIVQIDVDRIVPRAKAGSNDISNLQALCRTCNAQKRGHDDTDIGLVHKSYEDRDTSCVFCTPRQRVIERDELAFIIKDKYEVTAGHSLIIPKRHMADYFDLHMAERNAVERLLRWQKDRLVKNDETITGFNIGVNVVVSAGQTIFHVHLHLILRREGDVENPRGGVRQGRLRAVTPRKKFDLLLLIKPCTGFRILEVDNGPQDPPREKYSVTIFYQSLCLIRPSVSTPF